MDTAEIIAITDHLGNYVTDHKKEVIEKVLRQRTRHVTMVMEDIYQSQNASAVLRTCECYGVQDIHIIENENKYSFNRGVIKGAQKWLDIHQYKQETSSNTEVCFQKLSEQGYTILATVPNQECPSIEEVDLSNKIAVVIGNELHGLSSYALQQADLKVRIPMYGFTESLNLSVSAAICLNELIPRLHHSSVQWQLSEQEKLTLRLQWYRRLVRNAHLIEKKYLESNK